MATEIIGLSTEERQVIASAAVSYTHLVDIQAFAGAVVILGLRETALFFKIMLSERRQERVHDFGKCF